MLIIGLTGGIGSGKTTVCRLFAEFGVPIIDTDIIAREIVEPGEPALSALAELFGKEVLHSDGSLDRSALRKQVFDDENKRVQLERLLHPLIRKRMHMQISHLTAPYVIIAIPLLLEKAWQNEVDRILVVDTTEALQLSRTMARDGLDAQTVQGIIHTQASRQQRIAAADDIIHNDSDQGELKRQVRALHRYYQQLASE